MIQYYLTKKRQNMLLRTPVFLTGALICKQWLTTPTSILDPDPSGHDTSPSRLLSIGKSSVQTTN
jgi:hypothetical protein